MAEDGETTTVHCPLAFGSIAFWLGRKADEHATHKWTLYVRGPNGEDPSYFISKVVFYLHESFAQPIREISEPPFEVSEMGWGGFEARIRVYWKDESEEAIDFMHMIKLYPAGQVAPSVRKPVVHEFYDEIVFTNPSSEFLQTIAGAASKRSVMPHPFAGYYPVYSDAHDMQSIVAAQQFVTEELNRAKNELEVYDAQRTMYREKITEKSGKSAPR